MQQLVFRDPPLELVELLVHRRVRWVLKSHTRAMLGGSCDDCPALVQARLRAVQRIVTCIVHEVSGEALGMSDRMCRVLDDILQDICTASRQACGQQLVRLICDDEPAPHAVPPLVAISRCANMPGAGHKASASALITEVLHGNMLSLPGLLGALRYEARMLYHSQHRRWHLYSVQPVGAAERLSRVGDTLRSTGEAEDLQEDEASSAEGAVDRIRSAMFEIALLLFMREEWAERGGAPASEPARSPATDMSASHGGGDTLSLSKVATPIHTFASAPPTPALAARSQTPISDASATTAMPSQALSRKPFVATLTFPTVLRRVPLQEFVFMTSWRGEIPLRLWFDWVGFGMPITREVFAQVLGPRSTSPQRAAAVAGLDVLRQRVIDSLGPSGVRYFGSTVPREQIFPL
jgi:hypothetical protein